MDFPYDDDKYDDQLVHMKVVSIGSVSYGVTTCKHVREWSNDEA